MAGNPFRAARDAWVNSRDPATGDPISRGEVVSLMVAWAFRRWTFLILWQAGTFAWWFWLRSAADEQWWNAIASDLAIVLEGAMGIVVFGQMVRDGIAIRRILAAVFALDSRIAADLASVQDALAALLDAHKTPQPPHQPGPREEPCPPDT